MHKVIHLVVGTFEQELETSPIECLPVECGQSNGATGALYRKDGGSQSDRTLDLSTLTRSCDRTLECKLTGCSWSESDQC